jgi:hypothetical protein
MYPKFFDSQYPLSLFSESGVVSGIGRPPNHRLAFLSLRLNQLQQYLNDPLMDLLNIFGSVDNHDIAVVFC